MTEDTASASALEQLQGFMQAALLQQESLLDADQIARHIAPSARLSPMQSLAIYQRGYFSRLLQCMQSQFKALHHALGPELFADFAREYLQATPSRSPTLAFLGQDFATYLQSARPDAAAAEKEIWIDFMVDLAQFEWTLYRLFDAAGAEQSGYAGIEQADDPHLRLQACMRLCHFRFPVNAYYQQVARAENPGFPDARTVYLALVRTNYRIGIFSLLPAQHHFLHQVQQLQPQQHITDALHDTARVFHRTDETARQAWQTWRHDWLQAGFFVVNRQRRSDES